MGYIKTPQLQSRCEKQHPPASVVPGGGVCSPGGRGPRARHRLTQGAPRSTPPSVRRRRLKGGLRRALWRPALAVRGSARRMSSAVLRRLGASAPIDLQARGGGSDQAPVRGGNDSSLLRARAKGWQRLGGGARRGDRRVRRGRAGANHTRLVPSIALTSYITPRRNMLSAFASARPPPSPS